ncbi:MAG: hypothetical protein E7288_09285 [Lachnospiraceae bacterium]|nr:hypothetical protein [Lachnospiraceae bacterium]
MKRLCTEKEKKCIIEQRKNIIFSSLQNKNTIKTFVRRTDLFVNAATIVDIGGWEEDRHVHIVHGDYSIATTGYILDDFRDDEGNPYLIKHPWGKVDVERGERLIIVTAASDDSFLLLRSEQMLKDLFGDICDVDIEPDALRKSIVIPHPHALELNENEVVFIAYAEKVLTVYEKSAEVFFVADYDKPKMRGKYSYGNILRKYEKGKRMIFDAI